MEVDEHLLFYSQVDEDTKRWLTALHELWEVWKKSQHLSLMLTKFFEAVQDPYLSTLRILVNMTDFKHIKITSSLAYTAAVEFSEWILPRKQMYAAFLIPDIKLAAFKLISTQRNMEFIKIIATAYEFKAHKELFLILIEAMIHDNKYKEASQFITLLELQRFFTEPETLLLPLLLENKVTTVNEFLENCPDARKSLVIYLDGLLSPNTNLQETLRSYIKSKKLSDIKFTMQTKAVTKIIGRLIKVYNLPRDICPNLRHRQNKGALLFLIHKRYVDRSLNKESWREMVKDAIEDYPKIKVELLNMLASVGDPPESLYFANLYNIPRQKWPPSVKCYKGQSNNFENGTSVTEEDDWDSPDSLLSNYHTLALPMDSIKLITTAKSFETFVNNDLKDVPLVGIDLEWKPCFGIKSTMVALMQIATETNVYILDVAQIGKKYVELWDKLASDLFGNKNILKLGFGLSQDVEKIHASLPALSKVKTHGPDYIDMSVLWKILNNGYKFKFPYDGDPDSRKGGLSRLVELCLGRQLNKSNQCSNWERRPLRKSQLLYAALDAFCLIEVYNVILSQCGKLGIPFQEVCADLHHLPHKTLKTTKKEVPNKPVNAQYEPECIQRIKKNGQKYSQNDSLQLASVQRQQEKLAPKNNSNKYKNKEKSEPEDIQKEFLQSESAQRQPEKSAAKSVSAKCKYSGKKGLIQEKTLQPANANKSAAKNNSDKYKNKKKSEQKDIHKEPLQQASAQCQTGKSAAKSDSLKQTNLEKKTQELLHKESLQPSNIQCQPKKVTIKNNSLMNVLTSAQEPKHREISMHGTMNECKLQGMPYEPTVKNPSLSNNVGTASKCSIPVHTWRVVCDSMLGALSNKLRACGCDCIYIECDQGGYMSAMLASRENRLLLTGNTDYQKLLQFLPPGSCYRVMSESCNDQLREVLINFNVIVTPMDIFSRCTNCNSDEFANVPKDLMTKVALRYGELTCQEQYKSLNNFLTGASNINKHNKKRNEEYDSNMAAKSSNVKRVYRTWRLSMDSLNVNTCTTKYNAQIQLDSVPIKVFENYDVFYICERCGKVYCDGGKYVERLLNDVLKDLVIQ